MIARYGFCLLRHIKTPGLHVIACSLLHRELRGQIAFAVFQALFAITQLLYHVNVLLTSACKQA